MSVLYMGVCRHCVAVIDDYVIYFLCGSYLGAISFIAMNLNWYYDNDADCVYCYDAALCVCVCVGDYTSRWWRPLQWRQCVTWFMRVRATSNRWRVIASFVLGGCSTGRSRQRHGHHRSVPFRSVPFRSVHYSRESLRIPAFSLG